MKYILKLMFIFLMAAAPIFGATPHLMLYFDINKTLISSDKATGTTLEDGLNQLLASKYTYQWDATIAEPISYESYICEKVLTDPIKDFGLTTNQKLHLNQFIAYLKEHNHPLYPEVQMEYEAAMEKMKASMIFPSFYKLLSKLEQENIPYTLFLRSMGYEVSEIANEINATYGEIFKHYGAFVGGKLMVDNELISSNAAEIYELLKHSSNMAIQDDWPYWMSGDANSAFGKPFIIDPNDTSILSIFFDDNIKLKDMDKNIIAPIDANSGQLLSIEELVMCNQAVRVDTLQAILDDNYFIEHVMNAISKH